MPAIKSFRCWPPLPDGHGSDGAACKSQSVRWMVSKQLVQTDYCEDTPPPTTLALAFWKDAMRFQSFSLAMGFLPVFVRLSVAPPAAGQGWLAARGSGPLLGALW